MGWGGVDSLFTSVIHGGAQALGWGLGACPELGAGESQVPGPRGPPLPEADRGEAGAPGAVCSAPTPPQLTREFFTKELGKHYQGDNDTDIFSATWNSVMITVSGPGTLGACRARPPQSAHWSRGPFCSCLCPNPGISPGPGRRALSRLEWAASARHHSPSSG